MPPRWGSVKSTAPSPPRGDAPVFCRLSRWPTCRRSPRVQGRRSPSYGELPVAHRTACARRRHPRKIFLVSPGSRDHQWKIRVAVTPRMSVALAILTIGRSSFRARGGSCARHTTYPACHLRTSTHETRPARLMKQPRFLLLVAPLCWGLAWGTASLGWPQAAALGPAANRHRQSDQGVARLDRQHPRPEDRGRRGRQSTAATPRSMSTAWAPA